MESTRSPTNQKRRKSVIKKLASFGTTVQPANLSADQLILYLIQWLRLSKLISAELNSPTLDTKEKLNYERLQARFEEKVQPQLFKYKKFLNNQEPSTLQDYFSLKITEFLTLSKDIRRTNPYLASEILEQAEMFLRIYQSSIDTHIFQAANHQIKSNSYEVEQLLSKSSNRSESPSPKSDPQKTSQDFNQRSDPDPKMNKNPDVFATMGKNFQNVINKVQTWGSRAWDQIQETATEAGREIRKDIEQSSDYRRNQRGIRRDARDAFLFQKFSKLLAISRRILISDLTWQLKLTRRRLMEKLPQWQKKLDFRIDGKYIVSQSISFFSDNIDYQFKSWNQNQDPKDKI
ncbi:MAG: hypothetical protein ACTSYI_03620 [Promethearchaeota archaeon]